MKKKGEALDKKELFDNFQNNWMRLLSPFEIEDINKWIDEEKMPVEVDDNIEAAVQAVRAKGGDVTGLALSPTAGGALGKLKDANKSHIFPEFRFGQNPDSFYGMKSDINKTLVQEGGTAKKDHAIVGDFENMFKWGYAENIPMEVIEYGDPDGAGRDLKAYNEVCLRAEAFIGWGILDKDSFAIVKED